MQKKGNNFYVKNFIYIRLVNIGVYCMFPMGYYDYGYGLGYGMAQAVPPPAVVNHQADENIYVAHHENTDGATIALLSFAALGSLAGLLLAHKANTKTKLIDMVTHEVKAAAQKEADTIRAAAHSAKSNSEAEIAKANKKLQADQEALDSEKKAATSDFADKHKNLDAREKAITEREKELDKRTAAVTNPIESSKVDDSSHVTTKKGHTVVTSEGLAAAEKAARVEAEKESAKVAKAAEEAAKTEATELSKKGADLIHKGQINDALEVLSKIPDASRDSVAWCNIGVCHNRLNTPESIAEALKCYEKAADGKLAQAHINLAMFHQAGLGTPVNVDKAIENFKIALKIDSKNSNIPYSLKNCYEQKAEEYVKNIADNPELEKTIKELREKSLGYCKKAVSMGNPDAMVDLAGLYGAGKGGVEHNPVEAVKLYRQALKLYTQSAEHNPEVLGKLESVYTSLRGYRNAQKYLHENVAQDIAIDKADKELKKILLDDKDFDALMKKAESYLPSTDSQATNVVKLNSGNESPNPIIETKPVAPTTSEAVATSVNPQGSTHSTASTTTNPLMTVRPEDVSFYESKGAAQPIAKSTDAPQPHIEGVDGAQTSVDAKSPFAEEIGKSVPKTDEVAPKASPQAEVIDLPEPVMPGKVAADEAKTITDQTGKLATTTPKTDAVNPATKGSGAETVVKAPSTTSWGKFVDLARRVQKGEVTAKDLSIKIQEKLSTFGGKATVPSPAATVPAPAPQTHIITKIEKPSVAKLHEAGGPAPTDSKIGADMFNGTKTLHTGSEQVAGVAEVKPEAAAPQAANVEKAAEEADEAKRLADAEFDNFYEKAKASIAAASENVPFPAKINPADFNHPVGYNINLGTADGGRIYFNPTCNRKGEFIYQRYSAPLKEGGEKVLQYSVTYDKEGNFLRGTKPKKGFVDINGKVLPESEQPFQVFRPGEKEGVWLTANQLKAGEAATTVPNTKMFETTPGAAEALTPRVATEVPAQTAKNIEETTEQIGELTKSAINVFNQGRYDEAFICLKECVDLGEPNGRQALLKAYDIFFDKKDITNEVKGKYIEQAIDFVIDSSKNGTDKLKQKLASVLQEIYETKKLGTADVTPYLEKITKALAATKGITEG